MFTKNSIIKTRREIDGKINLYLRCIDCGFLKSLKLLIKKNFDLFKL